MENQIGNIILVDVGCMQAGKLWYGRQAGVLSTPSIDLDLAYEHPSGAMVICLCIWKDMNIQSLQICCQSFLFKNKNLHHFVAPKQWNCCTQCINFFNSSRHGMACMLACKMV